MNELRAALAKAGLHGKLADTAIEAMQAHLLRTPADSDVMTDKPVTVTQAEPDVLFQFGQHKNWELDFGEIDNDSSDCCWRVHRVNGGYNDPEWTLIGQGETPLEAIEAALAATEPKEVM